MSIEEVRSLVAERQRYDDWLAALEARRGETPARVFERVHGDYAARRAEVLTRLDGHVGTLELLRGDLSRQVADVTAQLDALEEQRVEAMIRNAVGEFDSARWEALRDNVEGQIGKLTDDRALVQMELEEIRELLAQARVPGSADVAARAETIVVPAAPPEPVAVVLPPPEPAPGPDVASEAPSFTRRADLAPPPPAMPQFAGEEVDDALAMFAQTPPQASPAVPTPLDDIVVDFDLPEESGPVASASAHAPAAPSAATGPANDPFDDLAFLRSVIDPSGSQPVVESSAPFRPAAPVHAAPVAPAAVPPSQAPQSQASGDPTKTLRCTECGTMNLPTEWYCERCGGELAAF